MKPDPRGDNPSGPTHSTDRDASVRELRHAHITSALDEEVQSGRLDASAVASILERLDRGADLHELRRELRAQGVLLRRSSSSAERDEGKGHV